MKINTLVIGSGGREHAIAIAVARSESCGDLFCIPGNPGIARIASCHGLQTIDHDSLAAWCIEHSVHLVVVGPEEPLSLGIAESLRSKGINVFGPSAAAAMLETSKSFAKEVMEAADVPTAAYQTFSNTQLDEAVDYVSRASKPVVIKADGLCAGKGVIIATTNHEAISAIDGLARSAESSASKLVIESFLEGYEVSLFAISDGSQFTILAPSQDHKRIGDGDMGRNTGGMGSYAPVHGIGPDFIAWASDRIIAPVLNEMAVRGTPFVGCLYAGLMVHANGTASVVEFNCRFGDPETQSVLAVFRGDFLRLLYSAARGELDTSSIESVAEGYSCTVVMASEGYPGEYRKGHIITGIENAEALGAIVHHSGTAISNGSLVTAGGRVLGVTGNSKALSDAIGNAYTAVRVISFEGATYRTDIGKKGIESQNPEFIP